MIAAPAFRVVVPRQSARRRVTSARAAVLASIKAQNPGGPSSPTLAPRASNAVSTQQLRGEVARRYRVYGQK
ncbi:hypothetical protein LZ31DRAFT_292953 [Colletotrichum somersetense]|nr:hypothetical protein LZ31DRAFT_292953 [Colletotrichum somersetense]